MTEPAGLTCLELVELVTDYLEGALSEGDRARFETHVAECEGCTTFLDHIRTTIRVTGALSEEAIPPHARDRLLTAFREWKGR